MPDMSPASAAEPLLSFAQTALRLASLVAPHVRRLHAERQAGLTSTAGSTDLLDQILTDTLSRLTVDMTDEAWWRQLLHIAGHGYVTPTFLKIVAVQEWLGEPDVKEALKVIARAALLHDHEPAAQIRQRLRESYVRRTGDAIQLADGPIALVEAILVAGFLSKIAPGDSALAAMLQSGIQVLLDRIDTLETRLMTAPGIVESIVDLLSDGARTELRSLLRRRILDISRARREITELERRFNAEGNLRFARHDFHVEVLNWAVRLHAGDHETLPTALVYRARLREIDPTADARIADARIDATRGEGEQALRSLRDLESPDARAVLFSLLHEIRGPAAALEWFAEHSPGYFTGFFTEAGWYNVIVAFVRTGRWDDALTVLADLRQESASHGSLAFLEGIVNTAMLFPEQGRRAILDTSPYLITFPHSEGPTADQFRAQARHAFTTAAHLLGRDDLQDHAAEANRIALWLRLTDPATEVAATATSEVREALSDGARAVHLLPVIRGLEIDFDPAPIRRYLERRNRIGGLSHAEILAEFVLAMLTFDARQRHEYLETNAARLATVLNSSAIVGERLTALLEDNQIARARAVLDQHKDALEDSQYERLKTAIDRRAGVDVRSQAEALYRQSGSLLDLHNLVGVLRGDRDWTGLRPLVEELFSLERTVDNAGRLVECLHNLPVPDRHAIVAFLEQHPDLTMRSAQLASAKAWSLFNLGQWHQAETCNRALLSTRRDTADLVLDINLAVQTGDWERFPAIIDREWSRRGDLAPATLMHLATIAAESDVTSDRAMTLARLATLAAPNDPDILVQAVALAFQLGRDNDADPDWIRKAADLSTDSGPVRSFDLRTIVNELIPAHREKTESVEHAAVRGEIPIHLLCTALNIPLSHVFLALPARNTVQPDGRRRTMIPAFSGARGGLPIEPEWSIGFDATSILSLAYLGLLPRALTAFRRIVLAPDTMPFLLAERRRVRFHQPSRVEAAAEVRGLIDQGRFEICRPSSQPPSWLVEEVGETLAELVETAKGGHGICVHPLPIHKIRSFGDEPANLREYASVVISTVDFLEMLHRRGSLDRGTFDRAHRYLGARDLHAGSPSDIRLGGDETRFLLDDLALVYLQGAGVLEDVSAGGAALSIHASVRAAQDALIEANRHGESLARSLDDVRRALRDVLVEGRATFLPFTSRQEEHDALKDLATIAAFFYNAASCDCVCVDDRLMNQHSTLTDQLGRSCRVVSTLDVLEFLERRGILSSEERREKLYRLRQGGFALVPIGVEEIESQLRAAVFVDGHLLEGPELRAIRQNLMRLRSLDMVQQPLETPFLDRLRVVCVAVIRRLWHDDELSAERATALADWVWRYVAPSPVDWLRTSRGKDGLLRLDEAVAVHLGLLLQAGIGLKPERQSSFSEWVERCAIGQLATGNPEFLDRTIDVIKQQIERWISDVLSADQ